MREVSLFFFCVHADEPKSPSLFGEGLGRGFYYAIQLVTPSVVPSAVRILISI